MSPARRAQRRTPADSPLVLDTRELGRRPGSMRPLERSVAAPADWSLGLVTVPPGSPVALDLRMESVMEGVLVSGTATVAVQAECGRCLEPVEDTLVVDVQELFTYDPAPVEDDEDPLPQVEDGTVDLEPTVRDAVVLALPVTPVCSDDCRGLCVTCGERLDDLPDDHSHDATDPRWAALAGLAETARSTERPSMPDTGSLASESQET